VQFGDLVGGQVGGIIGVGEGAVEGEMRELNEGREGEGFVCRE